jgi:hypothetical protein
LKKENGKGNSTRNGYRLYACIIVSRNRSEMAEKIEHYVEKRDDIDIKYYVVSLKHIEKLQKVGISLERTGCHHFVPQTLSSQVKIYIKNGRDKSQINKLKSVSVEMDFDLVISMPNFMHQNHNKVFAGDFTPMEVLRKLDWILDNKREFTNGYKIDIIDMFSMVSIFSGRDAVSGVDLGKIARLKENDEPIIPNDLMKDFNIKKENIVRYLDTFFFYPGYERFYKHFELLSNLRTSDRVRKSHVHVYMNYASNQDLNIPGQEGGQ